MKKLKARLSEYKRSPFSLVLFILTTLAAAVCVSALLLLVFYMAVKGIKHIDLPLFSPEYTTENVSLLPALINTVIMTAISLAIALPLGVFSAIYLSEYGKRGNKLRKAVGITAETLSGIPSVVYGLFGLLFFVTALGLDYSILSGALTLSVMILPLIMRTTEEALIAVPDSFREGSFGLGAGRLRTVFRVVLPSAAPGILSGTILATGRIVGETAALIYTAGTVAETADSVFSSGRTLSVHMYSLASEGLYTDKAYATALVLLIIVALINAAASLVAKRFMKGRSS